MSKATFGASAATLSGKAALLLGWRQGDFWAATPQELRVMLTAMMPDGGAVPLDPQSLHDMIARDEGKDENG